ncbi:MAG: hypothetical protein ISS19_09240 [Bacteroidales bacterium]|nr:hypothetical protein [Bacteroidales bacterium]
MKYLEYLTWILGILAGLIILLGAIAFVFDVRVFGVNHVVNYFHVANSFLLMCICISIFLIWKGKKD